MFRVASGDGHDHPQSQKRVTLEKICLGPPKHISGGGGGARFPPFALRPELLVLPPNKQQRVKVTRWQPITEFVMFVSGGVS